MRRIGLCCVAMGLAGCQPSALTPTDPGCDGTRPELGEIRVAPLTCNAQIPVLGEGSPANDLWLATNTFRVVIRHPLDAYTVLGLGGGTIIDAAPWPGFDTIHEVIPIVGGGWLTEVTLEPQDDGYLVHGTVAALPGRVPRVPGELRTIRYRADPEGPFLTVDGAEGFWINPLGDEVLYDGLAHLPGRVLGAVGEVADQGGVYEVLGTDQLVIGTDLVTWAGLAGEDGRWVGGRAPAADEIELLRDDRVVGRVPIVAPEFDFLIPSDIEAVRSVAEGRVPSAPVAPSRGLWLVLGDEGSITLVPEWEDGRPHWFTVDWASADGRTGRAIFGPDGGALEVGAGTFELALGAGPVFSPTALHVEVRPDEALVLPIRLPMRVDPGSYVLAGFRRKTDRSWDWRGSDFTAAQLAAAEGLAYATFTPESDVGGVSGAIPGFPRLPFRNGVLRTGDGYALAAWPWGSNDRKALHGAPRVAPRSPNEEAASMRADSRTLNVDLGWLASVGAPHLAIRAEQVWLEAPTPDLASWEPWFGWLSAARPLIPTGPYTWVRVDDPLLVGLADVEQSLARGDVCAGTGPRVALLVDGLPPGEQLPVGTGLTAGSSVVVQLQDLDGIDHLGLVTEAGVEELPVVGLQSFQQHLDGRWALVAAWSSDPGGPWAVTGPVWLSAP